MTVGISPAINPPQDAQTDAPQAAPTIAKRGVKPLLAASAALVFALTIAWGIQILQARFAGQPERAVSLTAVFLGAILAAVPGVYLLRARRRAAPETASLLFLGVLTTLLLAVYFFWVRWYVMFPADIWIWSEGDFINDMVKFTSGYPLYTAPVNLDSTHYPPVAQLLTYFLALLMGKGSSIPAFRAIQVGYTALASFMAVLCCRRILRMAWPESRALESWCWNGFWYAALFLMATNSITNRFAHNLHGDALAQLATVTSCYLLLAYVETRSTRVLAAMVVLVPFDFFIKQNLLIWGVFFAGYLALQDRAWKRLAIYCGCTSAIFAGALAVCNAVWGSPFFFWIFTELSKHAVSPLRGFQHLLDSWAYFAIGLLGGAAILRGRKPELLGPWLIWLLLIASETYTSGIEWMLNHIGPGCLMAGVWFLAGLASVWDRATEVRGRRAPEGWLRAAAISMTVALLFNGMGLIRIPLKPVTDDLYRYVRDIEKQFQGFPSNKVLLDVGNWVYMRDRVVTRDHSPVIGMLGMAQSDSFSGIISRIKNKQYEKIMVRDLHDADFGYENELWPRPSGIRQALLENYNETGRIPAAVGPKEVHNWAEDPYMFDEITILEPKFRP